MQKTENHNGLIAPSFFGLSTSTSALHLSPRPLSSSTLVPALRGIYLASWRAIYFDCETPLNLQQKIIKYNVTRITSAFKLVTVTKKHVICSAHYSRLTTPAVCTTVSSSWHSNVDRWKMSPHSPSLNRRPPSPNTPLSV